MDASAQKTLLLRQIQGLAALLSCLPAGGKTRELFTLALALDEGPVLDRVGPPKETNSPEGMRTWLESLWAADGITPEEKKIADWQADGANVTAALAEFEGISAKLNPA